MWGPAVLPSLKIVCLDVKLVKGLVPRSDVGSGHCPCWWPGERTECLPVAGAQREHTITPPTNAAVHRWSVPSGRFLPSLPRCTGRKFEVQPRARVDGLEIISEWKRIDCSRVSHRRITCSSAGRREQMRRRARHLTFTLFAPSRRVDPAVAQPPTSLAARQSEDILLRSLAQQAGPRYNEPRARIVEGLPSFWQASSHVLFRKRPPPRRCAQHK